jgi:hypothetical protein
MEPLCEMASSLGTNLVEFSTHPKCANFLGASVVKGLRDTNIT